MWLGCGGEVLHVTTQTDMSVDFREYFFANSNTFDHISGCAITGWYTKFNILSRIPAFKVDTDTLLTSAILIKRASV